MTPISDRVKAEVINHKDITLKLDQIKVKKYKFYLAGWNTAGTKLPIFGNQQDFINYH